MDSALDPWAFELIVGTSSNIALPDGRNIKKAIADTLHRVQKRILETDEGDTKSIHVIINV